MKVAAVALAVPATPFLAAGDEAEVEISRRATRRRGHHQERCPGSKATRIFFSTAGARASLPGLNSGAGDLWMLLIIGMVEGVMAGVEETLADRGDHAHERNRGRRGHRSNGSRKAMC